MKRAQGRRLGIVIALLVLMGACSGEGARDADALQGKSDLTRSLIDAAATAKAQNDLVTAVTYYRSALSREPDNMEAAAGLLQSLRLSGGLDEARIVAAKVVASKTTDPAALAEAGKVELAVGQLDDGVRLLKRAASLDAKDAATLAALGLAYDRLGEYPEADTYYKEALAIAPSDANVLNDYALSRAMANDLADAVQLLERAAGEPNADLRVRQNLALVYALSGDMPKAEALTRRDLPPAMVAPTLDYYRQIAADATPPQP
ncbi:MAG TPA: tetratricopeptide repeat protein [Stellaceae bacterium]|nr:tetratricopeptide repeat protein [Stellaceae bacterium]